MCISNNDPEMRGRVQIFIPHIMPTVYEYADESTDIEFSAVGDNIAGGLRTEIVEKLKAVLPWAESASPIVCSSTPGALIPGTNQVVATPTAYPVSSNSTGPVTLSIPNPSGANVSELAPGFARRLESFYQEAKSLNPPYRMNLGGPRSAFRSYADQKALFDKSGGSGAAASPGNSAHEYGIAVDLKITGPGVSIMEISVDASRSGRNHDTAVFRALLGKHGLHQPLHPEYNKNPRSMEHWHIEPIETSKVGGPRGSAAFAAVRDRLGTQVPLVSSTESTAPAQPPIPAALASQTETSGLSSGSGPLPFTTSPGIKALLAAIALGESSFSSKEASKNDYNLVENNANVRKSFENARGYRPANQDIAVAQQYYGDYGFFQNNDQTEGATVEAYLQNALNYPAAVASYYRRAITNDAGKGNFSLADQSQAMVFYLQKTYPTAVQALGMLDPSDPQFESKVKEIAAAHNIGKKWFGLDEGLRDRAANPNSDAYKKINGAIPVDATNPSAGGGRIASTTNTNPYGPVNYIDTNDRPRGTFAIPAPGAMLWVFFREGNPQFPVFFATSFSQKEWAASGVYNSGGAQTYTNSGAGQMISTDILTPEGVTHSAFTVGGGDTGSNLSFAPDHTSLYSAMSFRQDTMHDSFHVIGGNHEQKVYGESSHTVFGDRIRRVGTFTDEAYEAANQLWAQVKETNDTLAQPS